MGRLDGKVAVVTGAGSGLGRAYALALAGQGAKLVVNDLGIPRDGSGDGDQAVAERVVAEIRSAGGEATASFATVASEEGAQSIVRRAVASFGRLDVLVNNAGILRDASLDNMTLERWAAVLDVHLTGTYLCTRFGARQMVDQDEGGRIINTTSLAGLMGNVGQTNYGAAKSGIVGFTRSVAFELRGTGITVNAIAPIAKTRLTADIGAVAEEDRPEHVAPLVLFLASELAQNVTGRLFGMHRNHLFEYRLEMTQGIDKGAVSWDAEEIARRLPDIARSEAEQVRIAARQNLGTDGATAAAADRGLRLFRAYLSGLKPRKAAAWQTNLHFEIDGCGDYTLRIDDGRASVSSGLSGEPTCVIRMAAAIFEGMATGELDGAQAFMQGKIHASEMGEMVRFGTAFSPKKARPAVLEALAAWEADRAGHERR